jgi:uncharacterized membrane protein YfcA
VLALAVLVGLAIGASLGALGGGGSILTVPALVYLLGQSAHSATTVSLVVVGVSALAGMALHARAGRVRLAEGATFGALGAAGSVLGSRLSAGVAEPVLLSAFGGLMLAAAGAMAVRSRRQAGTGQDAGIAEGTDAPGPPVVAQRKVRRRPVTVVAAASVVGLVTGFFGVGGGFVVLPALVLVLGFEMSVAVGTSLLVIAVNSAVALAARIGTHVHVDWPLLLVFTAAAMTGALLGTRLASFVSPRRLASSFTVLLVAVALYTIARSVAQLA